MKFVIAFAPLLLVGLSIQAQTEATSPASEWAGPPIIKEAPYFADIVSTYDRTTPSGERLHREMHSKIYRDTQGRTRREVEQITPSTGQKWVSVLINDPISNTVTSLDPRTMTAHIRDGSIISAPPKQAVRGTPDSLTVAPAASSAADEPAGTGTFQSSAENKVEHLGTQVMEGLEVKGTKISTPLASAAGGNRQPRMLVSSTWDSEELHITVLTKYDEAPANHRTIRLVNIVRTEPEAELFKIPSGYAVIDSRSQQ